MSHPLTIDRFEGDDKQIAVLVAEGLPPVNLPRALLPEGAEAGDVLALTLKVDKAATQAVAKATKALQEELTKDDTGEDIAL